MREIKRSWRYKRLTAHFATVKAIVFMYLVKREFPVKTTKQVFNWSKRWGESIDVKVTYAMVLESLHELDEQGFVDGVGNDYGYYWWAVERWV